MAHHIDVLHRRAQRARVEEIVDARRQAGWTGERRAPDRDWGGSTPLQSHAPIRPPAVS
jgi:hypothetical protein